MREYCDHKQVKEVTEVREQVEQTDTIGIECDDGALLQTDSGLFSVPFPESRKVTMPLEARAPSHLQKATAVQFTQPHLHY